MAGPNSTLHDIASSIEDIHNQLANLTGIALDQGWTVAPKSIDRALTLLRAMESGLEELAAVRDAAYALSRAEKKQGPHAGSFKEGAAACLEALRRAEKIGAPEFPSTARDDDHYFERRDQATAEIMHAAGTVPPYAAGAIKVLAEYVVGLYQGGQFNLCVWKPEALMTEEESAAQRQAINAACA